MEILAGLIRGRIGLFSLVVMLGILAAGIESFGITFFLPLLSAGQSTAGLKIPLIGDIAFYFEGMGATDRIRFVALALIVTAVIRGICVYLQKVTSEFLQTSVEFDIRRRTFNQVLDLSVEYVEASSVGDYTTKIMASAPIVGSVVLQVSIAASAFFQALVFGGMLLLLSAELTAFSAAAIALTYLVIKVQFRKRLSGLSRELHNHQILLNQSAMETISSLRFIHLAGIKDIVAERTRQQSQGFQHFTRRSRALLALVDPLFSTSIAMVIGGSLFAVTIVAAEDPQAYVAVALMFMFILFRLSTPVMNMANSRSYIEAYWHYVTEVTAFLDPAGKPFPRNGTLPAPDDFATIRAVDVSFSYAGADTPALSGVNLNIQANQITALVGGSGSGKSTFLGVLGRLFEPQGGQVLVGDVNLAEMDIASWRRKLFVVTQEPYLFFDTVRANLLLAKPDATDGDVWEALRAAAADDFIAQLPQGLDTMIGDRGVRLSGGQRQRLSLARALLAKPKLLVLDEATSQLDSETERYIQETILTLKGRLTILVVAHRLSTIREADMIYTFRNGTIVENGQHESLMKLGGYYRRLVDMQARGVEA